MPPAPALCSGNNNLSFNFVLRYLSTRISLESLQRDGIPIVKRLASARVNEALTPRSNASTSGTPPPAFYHIGTLYPPGAKKILKPNVVICMRKVLHPNP